MSRPRHICGGPRWTSGFCSIQIKAAPICPLGPEMKSRTVCPDPCPTPLSFLRSCLAPSAFVTQERARPPAKPAGFMTTRPAETSFLLDAHQCHAHTGLKYQVLAANNRLCMPWFRHPASVFSYGRLKHGPPPKPAVPWMFVQSHDLSTASAAKRALRACHLCHCLRTECNKACSQGCTRNCAALQSKGEGEINGGK